MENENQAITMLDVLNQLLINPAISWTTRKKAEELIVKLIERELSEV